MRRLTLGWLLAASVLGAATVDGWARAGGGHSYSGGSHSSSGGGRSYSGSGGRRSGSGEIDLFHLIYWGYKRSPLGMTVLLVLLGIVYYRSHGVLQIGYDSYVDRTIVNGLRKQSGLKLHVALADLRARDPNFDPAALLARAQEAFKTVQAGWSAQNLERARAFMTDGVFERFTVQIAMQRALKLRNDMSQVEVLGAEIAQLETNAVFDAVHVRFEASAVDRDLSLVDGGVLRGGDSPETFEEVWTFLRRRAAQSKGARGSLEGFCPNCGAPLELVDAAQCVSCKSWVNSGEHDWVLSKITQISEWGPREADRETPGYAAYQEIDPGVCSEFLEDRASVAFWRMQEALWRGSVAQLRASATEPFCSALQAGPVQDGLSYADAAVGGVVLLAMERAADYDRAHVVVRWSGRRVEKGAALNASALQHVFILIRRAGVKTDLRAGLRSSRCGACGAPPVDRATAKCEYCGAVFNDGGRHWVLADMIEAARWSPPATGAHATVGDAWAAELSPRDALVVLAAGVAADGKFTPDEEAQLRAFAGKKGVRAETLADVLEAARAGSIEAPRPDTPEQGKIVLRGLIAMSLADGRVDAGEQQMLRRYGLSAGLPLEDVDALVASERERMFARGKEGMLS